MNRLCVIAILVLAGWTVNPGRALACADLQPGIQIDSFFKSVADDMLAASPTFIRQCERIAAVPTVRVSIRALPQGEPLSSRARTMIRRYPSGALIAWVEIPALGTTLEYAELLGHEFEHVLEQIDLVDLASQADQDGGVWRVENGAFETERARLAGETVATEVAAARAPSARSHPPH